MQRLTKALDSAAAFLNATIILISAAFTAGYVALISFEVFARYFLHASQSWTFELATYLFLISVFLGSATGFWERTHLAIVEPDGPGLVGRLLKLTIDLICIAVCAVMVWFGYRYAIAGLGRISPSMGFKMAFVYAWVPVTCALSILFIVARRARKI